MIEEREVKRKETPSSDIDLSKLDPTKLDEYAKTDPVARRVTEYLNTIPTIMTMDYLGRLSDIVVFIGDLLGLYEMAKKNIVQHKMKGMAEMLMSYVRPEVAKDQKASKEAVEFMSKAMEVQFETKVRQYEPWLLNQGLVMLCTALEIFFEHVLDVVLKKEPQRLLESDEARKVDLRRVIELGSSEAVIHEFIAQEIRRFSFQDTDARLRYLERRCSIKTAEVFSWSSFDDEVKKRFSGWDAKTLRRIFDDRHSVVHAEKTPITTYAELSEIKEFFDKIVLNVSRAVKDEYKTWTQFDRYLQTAVLYGKFRKEGVG